MGSVSSIDQPYVLEITAVIPNGTILRGIRDDYEVTGEIGHGGFGYTYEVTEVRGGIIRVLKVLHKNNHRKPIELFEQEYQILRRLDHPGFPKAIDYFTFEQSSNSPPLCCIIMEKVEGVNLKRWMEHRNHQPISEDEAIHWLAQLAKLLQILHHHEGFFHRDIKPENIIRLDTDDQLVLIDFGTARAISTTVIQQKQGITSLKSEGYTPQEQLNASAKPQSDFFALGRTMVYLLTGKEPQINLFEDPKTKRLIWREETKNISTAFLDLVDDLMAVQYTDRPQSGDEILQRINTIQQPPPPPNDNFFVMRAALLGFEGGLLAILFGSLANVPLMGVGLCLATLLFGSYFRQSNRVLYPKYLAPLVSVTLVIVLAVPSFHTWNSLGAELPDWLFIIIFSIATGCIFIALMGLLLKIGLYDH